MKIEIECLGEFCGRCENLKVTKKYDEDYKFIGWRCEDVGRCRYIIDEYMREINEKIGTIARR